MKFIPLNSLGLALLIALTSAAHAQTNDPTTPVSSTNSAIVPVSREPRALGRQNVVLQRAKENPGAHDVLFIGDSITQGWEGAGKNVWAKCFAQRKCLNFGVGGDRTQHVLWRFENGQLDGLQAKAAVVMIGTNNSNREDNTEAEILEGVRAIVAQLRQRLPDTKVIVFGIFPRGATFSAQRGKNLQVNQALAKLDDGKMVHYLDIGSQLIEADGSIAKSIMPDALHLTERGYEIWGAAIEAKLKELGI